MGFLDGILGGGAAGSAAGPWGAIAGGIIGGIGSFLGSDSNKMTYTPNPTWLSLQTDIMNQVQAGMAAKGYTWDDATNTNLKRLALQNAATPYQGAQEKVMSGIAPYGNVGSMGRALTAMNTSRAQNEATAATNIDVARAQNQLSSYQNLLNLGAGIRDPNLPQFGVNQFNASQPSTAQMFGAGLTTGVGTYMNLNNAANNNNFWQSYLNSGGGSSSPSFFNYTNPGNYSLNTNLGIFSNPTLLSSLFNK